MILVFIGAQGSGKGTQAKTISQNLNLSHISTGDLLRNAQGELKEEIDSYIHKGNLVPNELILKLLKEKIEVETKKGKKGFILDGYPRNLQQAEELDKILVVDKVIEIFISDNESIKRLSGRLSCKCGAVFNKETNPPKKEGICDICSNELYTREDDTEDAIKKRLEIYHKDTFPILEHYQKQDKVIKINGEQEIKKVEEDILSSLS